MISRLTERNSVKLGLVIIFFILSFCFTRFKYVEASNTWWDASWQYRRNITIDNSQNSNDLTNYQVFINVTYDSDMQLNFDDLRFTWYNSTGEAEVELNYWIENKVDSSYAEVWVNITSLVGSGYETVYMYYGNLSVSTTSNGTNTFDFFDDFNSLDTNVWIDPPTSLWSGWTIENGNLVLYVGTRGTSSGVWNVQIYTSTKSLYDLENKTFEIRTNMSMGGTIWDANNYRTKQSGIGLRFFKGIYVEDRLYGRHEGVNHWLRYSNRSGTTSDVLWSKTPWDGSATGYYILGLRRNGDDIRLYENYNLETIYADSFTTGNVNLSLITHVGWYWANGWGEQSIDWARVRKHEIPEPTYSFGSEEEIIPPQYFDNSTNSTVAGKPTEFRLRWTDNVGLGGYIFSSNNTGTWTNDSFVDFENQTGNAIFIDGYESGDFSAWTGTAGSPAVVNTISYHGTYSMEIDATNEGSYKLITTAPTLFMRAYAYYNETVGTYEVPFSALYLREDNSIICYVGIRQNTEGDFRVRLVYFTNGTAAEPHTTTVDSAAISWTNESWHSFEVKFVSDDYNGEYRVWYDGVEVITVTGLNTSNATGVNHIRGAGYAHYGTFYIDRVVASTSYIGPDTGWSNVTKTLNDTVGARVEWCVYANDTSDNWNGSSCDTPFSLTTTDGTPPTWSDNKTSPTDPVKYSPGQTYQFNISWIDNVGIDTVLIEQNFTTLSTTLENKTMSNETSEYFFDVSDLPAGNYVWRSYANDASDNWNETDQWVYTILSPGAISIDVNATTVWWGATVNVSGIARKTGGGPIFNKEVKITLDNEEICLDIPNTTSDGWYSCVFDAPLNLGINTLKIEVTDPVTDELLTNTTTLEVKIWWGEREEEMREAANVGCYEVPKLIQNPDGTIKRVMVRVCVWK